MRIKVPNRMKSVATRLNINDRRVISLLDYQETEAGLKIIGSWIKLKKEETELGRELTASGKLVSLLLQYGCPMKEIADTLTKDSYCGAVTNYVEKNVVDILCGNQPEKTPKLNTDPYKIKQS
tara:strand:+ start:902 stop:1270 length:369 start_codon:yes stop_codon:yes gene_type:complete